MEKPEGSAGDFTRYFEAYRALNHQEQTPHSQIDDRTDAKLPCDSYRAWTGAEMPHLDSVGYAPQSAGGSIARQEYVASSGAEPRATVMLDWRNVGNRDAGPTIEDDCLPALNGTKSPFDGSPAAASSVASHDAPASKTVSPTALWLVLAAFLLMHAETLILFVLLRHW